MPPVTHPMSGIDESPSEGIPSELQDEALVREVKVNLAHLHRKIDIMSAQVNKKLDSIMTWQDGSNRCMPNGTIGNMPNGTSNGKVWYEESDEIGPGAMSGRYRPQPLPLPAGLVSHTEDDTSEAVDNFEHANRLMSFGPSHSFTSAFPNESQPIAPVHSTVATQEKKASRGSMEQEKVQSLTNSRPPEVIGSQISQMKASRASTVAARHGAAPHQPGFSQILDSHSRNRRLKWHQRVLNFLEEPDSSRAAFVYSKVMSTVILCSCVLNFAQTIKPPTLNPDMFVPIEMLCDAFFLGEVSVRFVATPNKMGFFTSYHNFIDVLSSGPVLILRGLTQYTPFRTSDTAEEIRYTILCISPVFRMLKMLRRWNKFNLLMLSGFSLVAEVMPVLLVILFILAFVFSSLIYFVEGRDNIDALPKSLWFTIITMSTVGYGDVVPKTTAGNIITLILVICSALYMAVPLGIAGNAFSKVWDDRDWLLLIKYMHDRLTVNNYQAADIPNLFRTFGNDTGEIALDDFVRMISEMGLGIREDRLLDLFFSFDSDNSGTIDAMEFIRVIFPSQFVQMFGRKSGRKSVQATQSSKHSSRSDDDSSYIHSHVSAALIRPYSVRSTKVATREAPREKEVTTRKRESSFEETPSTASAAINAMLLAGGKPSPGNPSPPQDANRILVGITEKKETDYFFA